MAGLIRVEQLCKSYRSGDQTQEVLKGLDLQINAGELVAIMGQSGSGKSTLMNILGCLDVPSAGRYLLDGQDVGRLDSDRLAQLRGRQIGFVFQGFNLLPRNNALENVALPLLYAGVAKVERHRRAMAMLEQVGLADYASRRPNQLSGGQQQRVAIARALINQPQLILADEPTGNLDTQTSAEIMDLFQCLNRDRHITVILVTHAVEVAMYASRLIRISDGRVVNDGPTTQPINNPS